MSLEFAAVVEGSTRVLPDAALVQDDGSFEVTTVRRSSVWTVLSPAGLAQRVEVDPDSSPVVVEVSDVWPSVEFEWVDYPAPAPKLAVNPRHYYDQGAWRLGGATIDWGAQRTVRMHALPDDEFVLWASDSGLTVEAVDGAGVVRLTSQRLRHAWSVRVPEAGGMKIRVARKQ